METLFKEDYRINQNNPDYEEGSKLAVKADSLDLRINKVARNLARKYDLHPCRYAQRCEVNLAQGQLGLDDSNGLYSALQGMRDNFLEHLILGPYEGASFRPYDGVRIGIIGQYSETEPYANELERKNIPFTYIEREYGFRDADRPLTHLDFVKVK